MSAPSTEAAEAAVAAISDAAHQETTFSLELTQDQKDIRDWVHGFAADVVRPAAHEWDEKEQTPWPIIEEAAKIGQLYQAKNTTLLGKKTVYEDFKRSHPDLNFSALVMEGIWGRVPFPPGLFYDPKRARTVK